jgi:hypothetical protein
MADRNGRYGSLTLGRLRASDICPLVTAGLSIHNVNFDGEFCFDVGRLVRFVREEMLIVLISSKKGLALKCVN